MEKMLKEPAPVLRAIEPYLSVLAIPGLVVFTVLLSCGAMGSQVYAQSATLPAAGGSDPDGLIKLDVMVTDHAGKPVAGLGPADFTLLDNGQPAQVRTFQALGRPDPTLRVILLIDTLEMSEDLIRQERVAVDEFLKQNGGHPAYPVSIFELSNVGLGVIARSSRDGNELAKDFDRNRQVILRSAMPVDALERAEGFRTDPPQLQGAQALARIVAEERVKPGRKVLLWVGPGEGIGTGRNSPHLDLNQMRIEPGTGTGPTKVNSPRGKEDLLNAADWFSTALREARIALYTFSIGEKDEQPSLNAGQSGAPLLGRCPGRTPWMALRPRSR